MSAVVAGAALEPHRAPSLRATTLKPSCLISCSHCAPEGRLRRFNDDIVARALCVAAARELQKSRCSFPGRRDFDFDIIIATWPQSRDKGCAYEIKHDGFRVIARKDSARVRLYSRPGKLFADRGGLGAALYYRR
jgi:hypothetical protein